jgi:hypothetical protein
LSAAIADCEEKASEPSRRAEASCRVDFIWKPFPFELRVAVAAALILAAKA